jgi:hypothetical protein
MAATSTQAARIKSSFDSLWVMLRNISQIRADVTTMGGATFLASALDASGDPPVDPIPDLSSAQAVSAMQAVAAVSNVLGLGTEAGRKAIMALFFTADVAVQRSRVAAREFRAALKDIRQLMKDLIDASGSAVIFDTPPTATDPAYVVNAAFLAWLTAEAGIGATLAGQLIAAFGALVMIDATLDTGAGARRKDINRLAD